MNDFAVLFTNNTKIRLVVSYFCFFCFALPLKVNTYKLAHGCDFKLRDREDVPKKDFKFLFRITILIEVYSSA